ncbi:hypothetical protein RIR_jg22165.t1 [Rhizophagus irregularis DAOM 181602=DAOM 197198]|nr:hypothetical protein RIR_jg22165.t1 [Rhizophagus irregularis DAOM 181602=DAOM 197198]
MKWSFGIRLRKARKWASGVFPAYSTWKNEMDLRCLSLGNEETKGNAGRLDDEFETNRFRTMMETTGSRRLDNGNRNEPERQTFDDGVRNEPECQMKLRPGLWERIKRKGKGTFRRFGGSLDKPEFNISKVQRSLDVWNLTFRRFTPASTLALDI